MTEDNNGSDRVAESFRKTLNSHGHSFQRRIWRSLKELPEARAWRREVYEFPVALNGISTSIDMIAAWSGSPLLLVIECKRANPATASWCFARGPIEERRPIFQVLRQPHPGSSAEVVQTRSPAATCYSVGLEVKTGQPGDPGQPGRGAIEDAVTQVLRGMGGLMAGYRPSVLNHYIDGSPVDAPAEVRIVPVIVTTARLWVTEAELEEAGAADGELSAMSVAVAPKPWLLYRYAISPALQVSGYNFLGGHYRTFQEVRDLQFARTVAIVSAEGLGDFLANIADALVWRILK